MGEENDMQQTLQALLRIAPVRAALILLGSIVAGWLLERTVHRLLSRLAARTETDLDDQIVTILRRPLFLSAVFFGLYWATAELHAHLPHAALSITIGTIITLVILLWAGALMRMGSAVIAAISHHAHAGSMIQPKSVPLFNLLFKMGVGFLAVYFLFLAWRMDLTAWAASAGIIGVAIGFGAKDTLSNLFAGIFILADAPYQVGDFIQLDGGLRGRVTFIGVRSTRILTLDHVEITVPNGIIGNSRIINEAGGPGIAHRLAVDVSVAYGSDIEHVRQVLLKSAEGIDQLCDEPHPEARCMAFGASGINFKLLVWVREPAQRDPVLDVLHTRVYKAFSAAKIEIPYSKHDVYLKEMPAGRGVS
jgi:small-conductance mechanosensitive channel